MHLLAITKNGDDYVNISHDDYKKLCEHILDILFDGSDLNGFEPRIDWEDLIGNKRKPKKVGRPSTLAE